MSNAVSRTGSPSMPATRQQPLRRAPASTLAAVARYGQRNAGDATELLPKKCLQCFSVACGDMPQLEFGDKIVLPPSMLRELQCSKIPTPLLFQIQPHSATTTATSEQPTQYCSVQEFSTPEGTAYVPYWMMQRLLINEGATITILSVVDVPRGTYCRLQPESTSFLSLAADIGPKVLMESALRRYSVLSVDAMILVEYGSDRFYLRVVELRPSPVVSLCGDVDLETDFSAPFNSDLKRPRSQEDRDRVPQPPNNVESNDNKSLPVCEAHGEPSQGGVQLQSTRNYSLHQAQQRVRDRKTLSTSAIAAMATETTTAMYLRRAELAFNTVGHRLVDLADPPSSKEKQRIPEPKASTMTQAPSAPPSSSTSECSRCLALVPDASRELHAIRCGRNPAYHKVECPVCHDKILKAMKEQHVHCSQCSKLVSSMAELHSHELDAHTLTTKCRECGQAFSRDGLTAHSNSNECSHAFEPCGVCGLAYKRKDMAAHVASCASRTDKCEVCQRFVKVVDMASHDCVGEPTSSTRAVQSMKLPRINSRASSAVAEAPSRAVECPYCSHAGFKDAAAVEQHVASECRIARSFSPSQSDSNQREESEAPAEPVAVRELLQGRLRRKDDAARLVRTRFPPIVSSNQTAGDPSKSGARKSTAASTCAAKAVDRAASTAKKAHVQPRAPTGDVAGDLMSVRSSSCVLSAPAKRRHLAPASSLRR